LVYVLASCARKRKTVATRGKGRRRQGLFNAHATVTSNGMSDTVRHLGHDFKRRRLDPAADLRFEGPSDVLS
jgi:hypothetical protein